MSAPTDTKPKAQRLYEQWASAGGAITSPQTPYENIPDADKKRWLMMSKAMGDLASHQRQDIIPTDVAKYGDDRTAHPHWSREVDYLDYAQILEDAGRDHMGHKTDGQGALIIEDWPRYEEWKTAKLSTARHYWWQFWREHPKTLDITYQLYRKDYEQARAATFGAPSLHMPLSNL